MTQDHKAYPAITNVLVSAVRDNGGINRFRPESEVLDLLDECIGADGVYHENLERLDAWLAALSEEDLETVIGGEEEEMNAVLDSAPNLGDPEDTARDFINQCYEHCV